MIEKANNSEAGRDVFCMEMHTISGINDDSELKSFKEALDHKYTIKCKK